MATLNEIRITLLRQHDDLRKRMEDTREVTTRWRRGETDYGQVRAALARLTSALRTHNAAEEEALRAILPTLDPWGPIRAEVMLDEHVAEHTELFATLIEAGAAADGEHAAKGILRLLAGMTEHMVREEKTFLNAEALSEELTTDGFGG